MPASEKIRGTAGSQPVEGLLSPFLDEEFDAGESGPDWEARLGVLEAESPFLSAFEPGRVDFAAPEELEIEFLDEEEDELAWEQAGEPGDETEAHDLEALADQEDSGEWKDETEAWQAGEAFEEQAAAREAQFLALAEEPLTHPEARLVAEEGADALDESTYGEDETFLNQIVFAGEEVEAEQELDEKYGKTVYLPIKLNNRVVPKVGVFIPSSYKPAVAVDLIVYFHGHIIPDCKTDASQFKKEGMAYYWNTPLFQCLREDLAASGKQAILIAPSFIPIFASKNNSPQDYGDLDQTRKFDFLVNETLGELKKRGEIPAIAEARKIILSGHSGGGLPMQKIVSAQNALGSKIVECWGFECLYFGASEWSGWLKANSNSFFHHFRRGKRFVEVSRVLKKHRNFIDAPDATDHCLVVQEKWRKAIDQSPVFGGGGQPQSSPPAGRSMAGLTSLLAGLPGLASLPVSFLVALMKGIQNENELTNLIFFARHPELKGRKLTASDPKSLKDEWRSILSTIVLPAISRMQAVQRPSGAGSAPENRPALPAAPASSGSREETYPLTNWKLESKKIAVATFGDLKKGKGVVIEEAPSVFLPQIIGMARDLAMNDRRTDLAGRLDPAAWFTKFIRVTFLGHSLRQGQYLHLEMAQLLKAIEEEMVKKFGGSAKSVGDLLLNKSDESIAGSRLVSSTATFSMHMFGVAVDVNYLGNPYIQNHAISTLNDILSSAAGLLNKPAPVYKPASGFDKIQELDNLLVTYFGLLDAPAELERLAQGSSASEWRGVPAASAREKIQKHLDKLAPLLARGGKSKEYFKRHGILNFDKRFVVMMEDLGLHWGGEYGDMMHFDMRKTGVGFYIQKARLSYAGKVKKLAQRFFKEKSYGTHPVSG